MMFQLDNPSLFNTSVSNSLYLLLVLIFNAASKEEPIVFEKVVVPVKPKEEKVIQEAKQEVKVENEASAEKALNRGVETLLQNLHRLTTHIQIKQYMFYQ